MNNYVSVNLYSKVPSSNENNPTQISSAACNLYDTTIQSTS